MYIDIYFCFFFFQITTSTRDYLKSFCVHYDNFEKKKKKKKKKKKNLYLKKKKKKKKKSMDVTILKPVNFSPLMTITLEDIYSASKSSK